jgi:type IV pilus assembly protein PilC
MPVFTYKVVREDGTSVADETMAGNADELRQSLEARGYLVLNLEKKKTAFGRRGRGNAKDFLIFNQEFTTLVKAGLPILQSLEILYKRTEQQGFSATLESIIHEIKGGSTLSDAMAMHPAYFSPLYTATVRAGEKSGALVDVLKRFIVYQKKMLVVRRKLTTAFIYPVMVVTFVIAVMFLFLFYVIPSFTQMYSEQGGDLPFLTRVLISFTGSFTTFAPFILLGVIISGIGLYSWQRTDGGRKIFDKVKLKLPIIGSLIFQYIISQLARTLATLLRGGIPLIHALDTTAGAINNTIIAQGLHDSRKLVTEGISLAEAFERTRLMPDMTVRMVEVGESSGDLPQMLEDVADFYEDGADAQIPVLTTLIEVTIILFLGLVVAVIVLALYMPIFQMGATMK